MSNDTRIRGRWTRRLKYPLLILLAITGSLAAVSWQVGGKLVAPANRIVGPPSADLPIENVAIQSESGSTLAGWFASPESPRGVVVLLHGIRSNRMSMLPRARMLYDAGYAVLMVDFQAHGESPGECITLGYLEAHDARAAVEFAKSKHVGLPLAVIGKSLGGAAALLASPLGVDALVVESTYSTIEEATCNRLDTKLGFASSVATPMLLCQLKPRLGIDASDLQPINCISKVDCPVFVIGGSEDSSTTLAETQRMFDSARKPKQLLIVRGAGHADLQRFDPAQYRAAIMQFLESHLERHEK